MTEAVKAQASAGRRPGRSRLGLLGPLPRRVSTEVKELVLKTVDESVAAGFRHTRETSLWQVSGDRVRRGGPARRAAGTLEDLAPGDVAVQALLPWEEAAVLDIVEQWGIVDRSHRKLVRRGSYTGQLWVSPAAVWRILCVTPDSGSPPVRQQRRRRSA